RDIHGTIAYNYTIDKNILPQKIADIINFHLSSGLPPHEICVVAPRWEQIYPMANSLRKYLPSVSFDAPDIIPFKYDPMNPFYLLAQLLFTDAGTSTKSRKQIASELLEILQNEYHLLLSDRYYIYSLLKAVNSVPKKTEDGLSYYKQSIEYLFGHLNVSLEKECSLQQSFTLFLDKAQQRINKFHLANTIKDFRACFKERQGIVINTIHGIKGEEYDTVIGFDLLNGHLP